MKNRIARTLLGIFLVLSAITATSVGTAEKASATSTSPSPKIALTACFALGYLGECDTAAIPASSDHRIYYGIQPCGWGNIFDANTGDHVGPTNLLLSGHIGGLYGSYKLRVRNLIFTDACEGQIGS